MPNAAELPDFEFATKMMRLVMTVRSKITLEFTMLIVLGYSESAHMTMRRWHPGAVHIYIVDDTNCDKDFYQDTQIEE